MLLRIERFHSQWSQQFLPSYLQSVPGSLHREQLWSLERTHTHTHLLLSVFHTALKITASRWLWSAYHHHGDSEVGSELVVAPGAGGAVTVLIDAFLVHQLGVLLVGVIWGTGHPEASFKGLAELLVPLGVRDEHFLTWNKVVWF